MAKHKNGEGTPERKRSRPAKGGEIDPTLEELQRAVNQTPTPPETPPVAEGAPVAPEEPSVSPEVKAIFGDIRIPRDVREMDQKKLGNELRQSWLKTLPDRVELIRAKRAQAAGEHIAPQDEKEPGQIDVWESEGGATVDKEFSPIPNIPEQVLKAESQSTGDTVTAPSTPESKQVSALQSKENVLVKSIQARAQGDRVVSVEAQLRTLLRTYYDSSDERQQEEVLSIFARHKKDLDDVIPQSILLRTDFDALSYLADAYADKLQPATVLPEVEPTRVAATNIETEQAPAVAPATTKLETGDTKPFDADAFADVANAELAEQDRLNPVMYGSNEKLTGGIDMTPAEGKSTLRGLIEKAKGTLYTSVEAVKRTAESANERTERMKTYLAERAKELGEQMKEFAPKTAEFIGSQAEKYNKLNWKTKLAVTGGLIAGASLTSTAFPIVSAIVGGALYGQRAIGALGFAINRRKALDAKIAANPDHWLAKRSEREKKAYALALTAVYLGGTALAVHEAVEGLNALGVNEWLGNMLGHHTPAQEVAVPHPVDTAPTPPVEPTHGFPANSAATLRGMEVSAIPETPAVDVQATAGKGYEWMMKRVWEQLQEKHLDPSNYAEGSDIRRLLEADTSSIDRLVHQIAADPNHKFFNADGTSVRIDLDSHMTIDTTGHITLNNEILAPIDAPTTPAYQPEAPISHADMPTAPAPEVPVDTVPTSMSPQPSTDPDINTLAAQSAIPAAGETFVANHFGLEVPLHKVGLYAGSSAGLMFVFGGIAAERTSFVRDYITKNPKATIYGPDETGKHRVLWFLKDGKVTASPPIRSQGVFGLFSRFLEPPEPEEFEKIIK